MCFYCAVVVGSQQNSTKVSQKLEEKSTTNGPTGQREMDVIDYNKLERILVIYVMVLMAPDALRCLSLRSFFVILSFGTSIE